MTKPTFLQWSKTVRSIHDIIAGIADRKLIPHDVNFLIPLVTDADTVDTVMKEYASSIPPHFIQALNQFVDGLVLDADLSVLPEMLELPGVENCRWSDQYKTGVMALREYFGRQKQFQYVGSLGTQHHS